MRCALSLIMLGIAACTDREATAKAASPAPVAQDVGYLMNDANILATMAVLNSGEAATARVAQQRAARSDVRALAKRVVLDYERLQRGIDSIARATKIFPRPGPRAESLQNQGRTRRERLERLTVSRFDREYVQSQVTSDEDALTEIARLAGAARDPAVRRTILVAVPVIRSHRDSARALQRRMQGIGAG